MKRPTGTRRRFLIRVSWKSPPMASFDPTRASGGLSREPSGDRSRQRGQPLDEKGARGRISLEADCQGIGAARSVDLAQFCAKIGARDPIGLKSDQPALHPHLVQQFQSRCRPTRLCDRRCAIDRDDGGSGQREERIVENGGRLPVRGSGQPAGGVDRRTAASSWKRPGAPSALAACNSPSASSIADWSQRSTFWSLSGT